MGNNGRIRFLEPGEVQSLMESPNLRRQTGLRNRCVMGLMYEAGLRVGETPIEVSPDQRSRGSLLGHGLKVLYTYLRHLLRG